jgi:multisubunit Na+/H+ antiporter MnhF subunit
VTAEPEAGMAQKVARNRDVLLRLLSVTASLAGLCMAALGFMEYGSPDAALRTVADEVIAFDALLFVCCVYLILWALRTQDVTRAYWLGRTVDWVFLVALSTMLAAAACIVYRVF